MGMGRCVGQKCAHALLILLSEIKSKKGPFFFLYYKTPKIVLLRRNRISPKKPFVYEPDRGDRTRSHIYTKNTNDCCSISTSTTIDNTTTTATDTATNTTTTNTAASATTAANATTNTALTTIYCYYYY